MINNSMKHSEPSLSREDVIDCLQSYVAGETGVRPCIDDLTYCSWPELFGSTAGPFSGIGGQAMTTFRMEAWMYDQWATVFSCGRIVKTGRFHISAKYGGRS